MSDALQQHLDVFLANLGKLANEGAPKMPHDIRELEVDLERLQVELNKLSCSSFNEYMSLISRSFSTDFRDRCVALNEPFSSLSLTIY